MTTKREIMNPWRAIGCWIIPRLRKMRQEQRRAEGMSVRRKVLAVETKPISPDSVDRNALERVQSTHTEVRVGQGSAIQSDPALW